MTEIDHSAHTDGRFGSISQRISSHIQKLFTFYSLNFQKSGKFAVALMKNVSKVFLEAHFVLL